MTDAHEIEQLLYRYAIAIDTRNWELLDSCFTPDASIVMSVAGRYPSPAHYRDRAKVVLAGLDATHHVFSSVTVQVDGDRATAHSYYQAQHCRNALAPRSLFLIGGWVDDELTRVDGRWLISARRGSAVWFDGNPAVLDMDVQPGANPAVASRP
ncbi:nuclear transport factor 2 family protein [Dactylosporangium sp. NPDC005572]|uniref:nuclear transport factor 2 family protein n=1 Tax=Dactylosporangium sp. NPDC005572 TaxID=3156889 RepID=UPI0033B61116